MAIFYVRSTDGNNADSGATWALAKATIAGALAAAAAGDTIYVSQVHAESSGSNIVLNSPGTISNPVKIICANDSAEPPTALAASATVSTTTTRTIVISGSVYVYGITFNAGSGSSGTSLSIGSLSADQTEWITLESCLLRIQSTGAGARINLGSGASGAGIQLTLLNCLFRVANAAQGLTARGGNILMTGCVVSAASTPATVFFVAVGIASMGGRLLVENCDFTNCDSDFNFASTQRSHASFVIRNCRLPASWVGTLVTTQQAGAVAEMYNTDFSDTNYRSQIQTFYGSIFSETVIVRSGGASDGTTPLSLRMASGSLVYPQALASQEIAVWNESTGSPVTVTVQIVHDAQGSGTGGRLRNDECWLDVSYPGTSGFPLGVRITDAVADVIAAPADQADSAATWTTTGLATPIEQELSVTFTPQEKGWFIARVMLAKASSTVYVDPLATVS